MAISASGTRITGFVSPLTNLVYTYEYYWFGQKVTDTSECNLGGESGRAIDRTVTVGNAEDLKKGVTILDQSEVPYSPINVSLQSDPANILTNESNVPGGYFECDGYSPDIVQAKASGSYDPSLWIRDSYGDSKSGTVYLYTDDTKAGRIEIRSDTWETTGGNYTAKFEKAYSYIYLQAGTGGSVSSSLVDSKLEVGASATLTATPDSGWSFDHWEFVSGNLDTDYYGIDGSNQSKLSVTGIGRQLNSSGYYVVASCTYRAVFKRNYYNVSITSNLTGDNRVSFTATARDPDTGETTNINFPVSGSFKFGTRINVNISASDDFKCDYSWVWSDSSWQDYAKSWVVPVGGVSAQVIFTRRTYQVIIYCENGGDNLGGYYTINGLGHYTSRQTVSVHHGDTVSVYGHPNDGWEVEYSNGQYTTVNCGDGYLYIRFVRGTHTVTITAPQGEGCVYSVLSSGECLNYQQVRITHGFSIYLLAKGIDCHKFLRWTGIPSDKQNQNPVYVVVNDDMTIAAVFQKCKADGRLIHCKGDILFDSDSGNPLYQECDCS